MAEEQIILKRKAENKCIICGKEIDKQERKREKARRKEAAGKLYPKTYPELAEAIKALKSK